MTSVGLRAMRIWMIILTFFNLVLVTSHYAEMRYWSNWRNYLAYGNTGTGTIILKKEKFFLWQDIALVACSSILFPAYIGAYKILYTKLNKYLRALMMLVPTVLMLFVAIQYVHLVLKLNFPIRSGPPTPFDCSYLSGLERAYCDLIEFSYFFAIITGLFALLEICLTVKNGPMHPKNNHSYEPSGRYADDANIELIGPSEHSMLYLQDLYDNPPSISPLQFSPFIPWEQPILLSSPEQGKAIAAAPRQRQQQQRPILPSMGPDTAPVTPPPLQQQPLGTIFDTRAPLSNLHSVQPQFLYQDVPGTQYKPPQLLSPKSDVSNEMYNNCMPQSNPYSDQSQLYINGYPAFLTRPPPLTPKPLPLPEQVLDSRLPLPYPHPVQSWFDYKEQRIQYTQQLHLPEEEYDARPPLPNPTSALGSAGPRVPYQTTWTKQEYDQRVPLPGQFSVGPPVPYQQAAQLQQEQP